MKLIVSTDCKKGQQLMTGNFPDLVWASADLETVAHYYEGCAVELDVYLDSKIRMPYVRSIEDLIETGKDPRDYTYGMIRVKYPPDAAWYCLSSSYLKSHLKAIKVVNPDLSKWNEQDE